MKYLIAGLGNIGPEYELTRHNAGFLVADRLTDLNKSSFELSRYAFFSQFRYRGRLIYVIKPSTFMNLSGKAVKYWLNELEVPVTNLLVVVDDIALPFGQMRLRQKGSSAGHNGLDHIESMLQTQDYPRLKIGIGNDFPKGQQVDYVLSRFSRDQVKELDFLLNKACDVIHSLVINGISRTMSTYNTRPGKQEEGQ